MRYCIYAHRRFHCRYNVTSLLTNLYRNVLDNIWTTYHRHESRPMGLPSIGGAEARPSSINSRSHAPVTGSVQDGSIGTGAKSIQRASAEERMKGGETVPRCLPVGCLPPRSPTKKKIHDILDIHMHTSQTPGRKFFKRIDGSVTCNGFNTNTIYICKRPYPSSCPARSIRPQSQGLRRAWRPGCPHCAH